MEATTMPDPVYTDKKSSAELEAWAFVNGYICIYPKPNQLFIDVDTAAQFAQFLSLLDLLGDIFCTDSIPWTSTKSRSGGDHQHIVVELPMEITQMERLVLQACMGSDAKRELLGFFHLRLKGKPDPQPTVFQEKRVQAVEV
jgi:hypothetical protein